MPFTDVFFKGYSAAKSYSTQFTEIASNLYHSRYTKTATAFVVDTSTQLYAAGKFLYESPTVRAKLRDGVNQGWQGLRNSLRWITLYNAVRSSPELQKYVKNSFIANIILYAGPVIVYEGYIKPGLVWLKPDLEDTTNENIYKIIFFTALFAGALLKNLSYSVCITYETAKIAPKEHFPPCPHGTLEHVKANAESLFYYPRNLLTAHCASLAGSFPFKLIAALAYGQCLIESKFVETCTEDRVKIFRKNNAYIFMFGVSFMLMAEFLNRILTALAWWSTGSFFIRDAAMSFVFPFYIILSLLQDKPLPGTEEGIDFFEFNRYEVSTRLSRLVNWIIPTLMDEQARDVFKQSMLLILNFPPLKLLATLLAGFVGFGLFPIKKIVENPRLLFSHRFLTAETLLRIPEFHTLIQTHAHAIKKGVDVINFARSTSWIGAFIPGFLVSSHIKGALNMLASLDKQFVNRIAELPEIAKRINRPELSIPVVRKTKTNSIKVIHGYCDWAQPVKLTRSQSANALLQQVKSVKSAVAIDNDGWELIEKPKNPIKPIKPIRRSASLSALQRSGLFAHIEDSYIKVPKENHEFKILQVKQA